MLADAGFYRALHRMSGPPSSRRSSPRPRPAWVRITHRPCGAPILISWIARKHAQQSQNKEVLHENYE